MPQLQGECYCLSLLGDEVWIPDAEAEKPALHRAMPGQKRSHEFTVTSQPGLPVPMKIALFEGTSILDYWPGACDHSINQRVIDHIQEVMTSDPKFKKSKQVHKTRQAGVYHFGARSSLPHRPSLLPLTS